MTQKKILVVDDEKEVGELIQDYLTNEGYQVVLAYDGEEAIHKWRCENPDLIILDIMLPKNDGMEICRLIRARSLVPIIMLSARQDDVDKILSLGLGADDYVTKPFSPRELVARVKANLRRTSAYQQMESRHNLKFNDLEIDTKGYTVYRNQQEIQLATKEFELLAFLAANPNCVYTREQIFEHVWGFNEYGDLNTVTVHIRNIRKKIETDPTNPVFIKTVWGVGYKFEGEMHD